MLDLPEPFGPTAQVMPGSRRSVVAEAKDLKPRRVRLFRYKLPPSLRSPAPYRPEASNTANCSMTRVPRIGGWQACQSSRKSPATAQSRATVTSMPV